MYYLNILLLATTLVVGKGFVVITSKIILAEQSLQRIIDVHVSRIDNFVRHPSTSLESMKSSDSVDESSLDSTTFFKDSDSLSELIISSKSSDELSSEMMMSSESLDDLFDERFSEEKKMPLDQFLDALKLSIDEGSLLKLILSENDSTNFDNDDKILENEAANEIDWEQVKGWAAISGRLIKTKSESRSRLQLISYKDSSMKKSAETKNFSSSEDIIKMINILILKAFKKAVLSTKENDFEFKLRGKGQGKFRKTSKVQINLSRIC